MKKEARQSTKFSLKQLFTIWLVTALILGALLSLSINTRNPMADVDPAYQRPGLIDLKPPVAATRISAAVPKPGTRTVIFFSRNKLNASALEKLTAFQKNNPTVALALVEKDGTAKNSETLPIFNDTKAEIAASYHFDKTRDGGYPTGYSIVDSHGLVRFTTIDPDFVQLLSEVSTILEVTP